MLWSYTSNIHKLCTLDVMFQDRKDYCDYYFDSLTLELKSVIPRMREWPNLAEQAKHHSMFLQTDTLCWSSSIIKYWFRPNHKKRDGQCSVIGRYVKSPHRLEDAIGDIHWECLNSEHQSKPFSVHSRETKTQMKMVRNNPLMSPYLNRTDSWKLTTENGKERLAALYDFLQTSGLLPGIAPTSTILMFSYIWMIYEVCGWYMKFVDYMPSFVV